MVKFSDNYDAHIVRKWRRHYIDYESLKAVLASEAAALQAVYPARTPATTSLASIVVRSNNPSPVASGLSLASRLLHSPFASDEPGSADNDYSDKSDSTHPTHSEVADDDLSSPLLRDLGREPRANTATFRSSFPHDCDVAELSLEDFVRFSSSGSTGGAATGDANAGILDKLKRPLSSRRASATAASGSRQCFLTAFLQEIVKSENFFGEKMEELQAALKRVQQNEDNYKAELLALNNRASPQSSVSKSFLLKKRSLQFLYLEAQHLAAFRTVNLAAASKIARKRDKKHKGFSKPIDIAVLSVVTQKILERRGWSGGGDEEGADGGGSATKASGMDMWGGKGERRLGELTAEIVNTFAEQGGGEGNRQQAELQLRLQKRQASTTSRFHLGFRCGVAFMTLVWLVWDCSIDSTNNIDIWNEPISYVYTVVGSYLCLFFCWSLNVKIFEKVGIDYAHLLDWDEKNCKSGDRLIAEAALYGSLYCSNMVLYLKLRKSAAGSLIATILPATLLPIALLVGMGFVAVLPIRRRAGIWEGIKNVMTTPFGKIRFREVIIGDFLTSLPKPNTALAYSICYYVTGDYKVDQKALSIQGDDANFPSCLSSRPWARIAMPLIALLPLLWRLMQCVVRYNSTREKWPHLANALKYFAGFTVVVFGVFNPTWGKSSGGKDSSGEVLYRDVWILVFIIATLYQFFWDVRMDWGLFTSSETPIQPRPKNVGLFPTWLYWLFVPLDLILRFFWTLSLVPSNAISDSNATHDTEGPFAWLADALAPTLAICEVLRRSGWCLLRIEKEHLEKAAEFRSLDDGKKKKFKDAVSSEPKLLGEEEADLLDNDTMEAFAAGEERRDTRAELEELEAKKEGRSLVVELGIVIAGVSLITFFAYLSRD